MTQPQDPEYAPPAPPPPAQSPSQPAPPQHSCISRIMSVARWIITTILSAGLAIIVVAAILFYSFGLNLGTPGQIRQSSADVVALQSQNQVLQTEVALLSATGAAQESSVSSARERVGELETKVAAYDQQTAKLAGHIATAAALANDLHENIALAATIQAEARQGQMLAAVVATVQVGNANTIDDLQRRTDRIARFLQRMGDLAGEISQDATPTPAANATPIATPTDAATATP